MPKSDPYDLNEDMASPPSTFELDERVIAMTGRWVRFARLHWKQSSDPRKPHNICRRYRLGRGTMFVTVFLRDGLFWVSITGLGDPGDPPLYSKQSAPTQEGGQQIAFAWLEQLQRDGVKPKKTKKRKRRGGW